MTTIANSTAAKLFGAFAAVAMVLTLLAPAAQAQTEAELQAQIDDLLATISSLEAQLDGGGSGSGSCSYNFTTSMGQGTSGPEVMQLQQFLNMDPETRVAASGVGSAGQETNYYGSLTAAAVSKFQTKYRADVLTPLGLVNPTGYWGNSSIAKANEVCSGMTDDEDEDEDEDEGSQELSGGEASLEDFQGSSGDDTTLQEGQEDAPVAEFEFDVEDGDVRVNRIDVAFDPASGNDEVDPWDAMDEVSIWVDGDEIASEDVDDEDDWSDDSPYSGAHTYRFSGLDWVVEEDDTAEFTIGVTPAGGVVDSGNTDDWEVFIPNDGIRAVDGEGIQNYIGESDDSSNGNLSEQVSFDISEKGADDELKIQSSSDDPDTTTIIVEENSNSDWSEVFAFDLDTDDSTNDITVETIVLDVRTVGDVYNQVVNDARLVIDGDTYDDFTVSNGSTATGTLTFDIDDELEIDAGDEVTASLELEFKQQSGNYSEGQTVQAVSTTTSSWEAEGADDITVTGSATGNSHSLRTQGVAAVVTSTSESFIENDDTSTTDNEGEFTIKAEVTAFETDIFINTTAATGTATSSGVTYKIVDSSGNDDSSSVTSASAALSSSATETSNGEFKINEGQTETVTLKVNVDPATSDFYKVQLTNVNYDTTDNAGQEEQQSAAPAADFQTDYLKI